MTDFSDSSTFLNSHPYVVTSITCVKLKIVPKDDDDKIVVDSVLQFCPLDHNSVTILICHQHLFDFLDRMVENNLIKTFVKNVLSIQCIPNTHLDPFLNYLLYIEEFLRRFRYNQK